jgi:excisionase family DNA binding protein
MTSHADLSTPIHTTDEPAPMGGAPPTEGIPDFLTVVEAARILRIGRTSAYQLAQQWLYSDGRNGLPVVRVGRQLRVPRRALERLAGAEPTPVREPTSELPTVPVPSTGHLPGRRPPTMALRTPRRPSSSPLSG